MNLSKYLENKSASDLAASVGISNAYLSQIKNGVRKASPQICISIERETKGAIRCEDLRPDVDWAYLRGTAKPKLTKKAA